MELTHRAANRGIFAAGALRAAKWIINKPPDCIQCRMCWGFSWFVIPNAVEGSRCAAFNLIARCLDFARHDETKMRTAVAFGSNIGDRLENLRAARKAIPDLPNVNAPIFSSAVYETEPVDCERDAGKFLNAVVEFEYDSDPAQLLEQLIQIEETLGRKRDHPEMFRGSLMSICSIAAKDE